MSIARSYSESNKLYKSAVELSLNWISRYYPKNNIKFNGIPIQSVQAFSQIGFFSSLIGEYPIKNVWVKYTETSFLVDLHYFLFKSFLLLIERFKNIILPYILPTLPLPTLNKSQLLIISSGRHLVDLFPLVSYLNSKFTLTVIGKISTPIQEKLSQNNISYFSINDVRRYISFSNKINKLRMIYNQSWTINKKQLKTGIEKNIFDSNYWQERLKYLKIDQFPEIAALLETAYYSLSNIKPSCVLTTASNDIFGSSFCLTAKALKIPVIELQHGSTNFGTDVEYFHNDFQLVWGPLAKNIRKSFSGKTVDVGCPILKKPLKLKTSKTGKHKAHKVLVLLIPHIHSELLFLSQSNFVTISNLIDGLKKLPKNFRITLRSHPSFDLSEYIGQIGLPKNVTTDSSIDVYNTISSNDIIITQPTTAGLIAMMYNKPLLFFNNSWLHEKYGDPFTNNGCALNVPIKDLKNINGYVLRLLEDKEIIKNQQVDQKNFINNYCSCFGESSYAKIANFLSKHIKTSSI